MKKVVIAGMLVTLACLTAGCGGPASNAESEATSTPVPVKIGDSASAVIAALGQPSGKVAGGRGVSVWLYDEGRVTLENGAVVSVQLLSAEAIAQRQEARARQQKAQAKADWSTRWNPIKRVQAKLDAARARKAREVAAARAAEENEKLRRKSQALLQAQQTEANKLASANQQRKTSSFPSLGKTGRGGGPTASVAAAPPKAATSGRASPPAIAAPRRAASAVKKPVRRTARRGGG